MVKPRRNTVGRMARLAKMGAGLAGSYLAYQLQRPFLDERESGDRRRTLHKTSARKIREELQEMRGPVMKLGQALSMQSHLLDAEVIAELSNLQMQAPPMHPTLMRAQFKAAFGKYPEDVFRSFQAEPFAAASLGQVHHAVTKHGHEVVVKIQYPAIREAIESDFKMLRTAGLAGRIEPLRAELINRCLPEALVDLELKLSTLGETGTAYGAATFARNQHFLDLVR